MLHEAIYRLGVLARNPLIPARYAALLESQSWDREKLRTHQSRLLRQLLLHAQRASPYYRNVMSECGVDPAEGDPLAHLQRLPFLDKQILASRLGEIQNRVPGEKHFHSETSGSTGTPLVFWRNADWDAWHRASVMRGISWYGVRPWDRNGYLWGYNFAPARRFKVKVLDALQNRFRMFSYDPREMDRFLDDLTGARSLAGYSSMIYELARRKNQVCPERRYRLALVKGTSEKIHDHYQEAVARAFGRRITSEYGSAECGIIAFENVCGTMHLNQETSIVEEIDGQIVVTNLSSKSVPIIRYRLGDYVTLSDDGPCSCGMDRPAIREIVGRVGKTIHGKRNTYPSLTLYYVFKNLALSGTAVLNYQAFQKSRGALLLRIEEALDERQRQALMREIRTYYHDDLDVDIREQETILSVDRKRLDFISEIDE